MWCGTLSQLPQKPRPGIGQAHDLEISLGNTVIEREGKGGRNGGNKKLAREMVQQLKALVLLAGEQTGRYFLESTTPSLHLKPSSGAYMRIHTLAGT